MTKESFLVGGSVNAYSTNKHRHTVCKHEAFTRLVSTLVKRK